MAKTGKAKNSVAGFVEKSVEFVTTLLMVRREKKSGLSSNCCVLALVLVVDQDILFTSFISLDRC